jgi:hypothetical protein
MMNAFDGSVGVFVRGLTQLEVMLTKGEAHAAAQGIEREALLRAQLADDMYPLGVQAYWVAEGAKIAIERLLGVAVPPPTGSVTESFPELHQRIATTIARLRTAELRSLEAGLERTLDLPLLGGGSKTMSGAMFLAEFAIPSFYFHLAAAYGILRHEGVPLRKGDFLGM